MYIGVNAIVPGRRSRTRESIGAIRHVFLEADHDGPAVLARVTSREDLPQPAYVLHSSPNRIHVFWRAADFTTDYVEALQKRLAHELGTDPAATPASQATRLVGFMNHKYSPAHLVTVDYRSIDVVYAPAAFPLVEPFRRETPAPPSLTAGNSALDPVERAELRPRTFCTFRGEFSSLDPPLSRRNKEANVSGT